MDELVLPVLTERSIGLFTATMVHPYWWVCGAVSPLERQLVAIRQQREAGSARNHDGRIIWKRLLPCGATR